LFFFKLKKISKTVRDIENANKIKLVDLLIENNLLAGRILISLTVFEILALEKSQKTPPPLIYGKYFPDCAFKH